MKKKFITIDVDSKEQINVFPAKVFSVRRDETDKDCIDFNEIIDIKIAGNKLTLIRKVKQKVEIEIDGGINTVQCWGSDELTEM